MMDDHETLSSARINLSEALRTLLEPGIMDASHFAVARRDALKAVEYLDVLLHQNQE